MGGDRGGGRRADQAGGTGPAGLCDRTAAAAGTDDPDRPEALPAGGGERAAGRGLNRRRRLWSTHARRARLR
ncbi:hypothetical protein G6F56_014190 [Rhizopus delemar]|nr:hypothetical protein G6F56_014190 [Rhizopus delemar]